MRIGTKILVLSIMVIFPWVLIRLADLETIVIYLLNKRDTSIIGLVATPVILFLLVKWLFEPKGNVNKSDLRKSDNQMKTHK